MTTLGKTLRSISNKLRRIETTWGSLCNLAKRVLLLALRDSAIKIISSKTNKRSVRVVKQRVVMTKIKAIKVDNCGKVSTCSACWPRHRFVHVDLSHSINMVQLVPASFIVLITEAQPHCYKSCPRHSGDGWPMETFWETEGRLDINRLESGLVNLKGSAWIHLLSVPKRDAGETAPI